jgi:4-hydroxy 2-oxovalerate aldolase
MNEKYLLDCTLRDGGYLNDWDYGTDLMHSIFSGLVKAGVDFIEVGFLDDRRPVDYNRSINPTTACYDHIYQGMGKGHSTVLAMIDFGTCDIKNLSPKKDSFLDGIRVIFKKEKKEKAMAYVAEVKKLGYKVFAQMVSITAYEEKDLAEFVALANSVKPFGVSIVDTYGLLDGNELSKYADYLNAHLDPSIVLGFHAHNNRQLGFSNDLTFLQKNFARPQLVDGTLFGMGKSAGNSQTEQVVTELNNQYGKSYNKGAILDFD